MNLTYSVLNGLARIFATAAFLYIGRLLCETAGFKVQATLLQCFLVAFVGNVAYQRLIYRPFLDPLRKLPLIHISDIRILLPVTDVERGEPALRWAKQHQDADAVRVCVNHNFTAIVPQSTEALRDVLTTNQQDFEKPIAGRTYLSRLIGDGLILSEGAIHARQRKQLTSSFRVQNIRAQHGLMLAKTNLLIAAMESNVAQQGKCDITVWASKVTLDIIGEALMSQNFDSLQVEQQPVNDAFSKLTAASPGATTHFALGLFLPRWIIAALPTATNKMLKENGQIVRKCCEDALTTMYADLEKRAAGSDILASIASDPLASKTEVVDQMMTFLGAGHETTATSIAWTVHLLTLPENRKIQETLREEIRANPGCVQSPVELEALPWLNAVCEETMRLFPPVTATARIAIRDTSVANIRIPKGQILTLFPWAVNRNPRYWGGADSEKFIPQRWIDERPDGSLRVNKNGGAASNFCNITFLHGDRSCIGQGFSKAELRLIVAKIFGNFYVDRLPGDNGHVNPVGSITIKPEGGLNVTLKRVDATLI